MGSYRSLGTLVASVNVHCRSLGGKLSPPQQLGAGAAWAVPTQHPSYLSHQAQPQLVSWCLHITRAWAKQSHRAVPARCSSSQLPPALCFGVGTGGLPAPATPPPSTSTGQLCSRSEPWQPHCHSSQGIALEKAWGAFAPKVPDCPAGLSCGSCPHISGCLRPNNMVLTCDPALLKVRAALGLHTYGFTAPHRSTPPCPILLCDTACVC